MNIELFCAYLPRDRRQALAAGHDLPDPAQGAVLLADVDGFTPLADALVAARGPQRGAEELTRLLNDVYDPLVAQVHRYGGSVVSFVGDALLCCFEGDAGLRAVACALAMQQAMISLTSVSLSGAEFVPLSIKCGLAAGPVRRFLVGRPHIDLLAGGTLDRVAQAEQAARPGEVVVAPETVRALGGRLSLSRERAGYAVVAGVTEPVPTHPWPERDPGALTPEQVRPYLLPPVYERLAAGQREFLAELRPAVALFLRFAGLDYERDGAGAQLDGFVSWVQGVLARYGGHLLQLTAGDKGSFLYAAFGAPAAHEDDAERALGAAMTLRQPPSELGFISGVQVGLSQGRMRTGAYGGRSRRSYGVIGPEAVVACRLMEAAPAGEVWCGPALYGAARGRWSFEALEPVTLKGKAEPLPVYRPLRPVGGRAIQATGGLIGRQAEMESLTQSLAEAQAGRRRVLLLEGEAGIGKSRLLAELELLARQRELIWLGGAGQSIEQGTPYRAWRDLLTAYFRLDPHMDQVERGRRVQEQVAAVNPALAQRAPLLNDVLRLGLPETTLTQSFEPQLRHESLTALLVDLLRAKAAEGPLALALEDGHWLDSLSWELALSVARALYDRPLLLVVALRPLEEPVPAGYTALTGLEGAEVLPLEALSPEQATALAAARLGVAPEALPAGLADLIQERAGGNPFFAEELALGLRESGAVVVRGGACSLSGDLATLRQSVPDTVEGVVLARIDRLPPAQQLTLKVAAVVGRSFLYRTLRDVHPRQVVADLLRAQLDDLAWRGLTPLESLEPELSYLFKHVITQQVAYDRLLFAQRRELHRAVAGWYERAYDDLSPFYPLLAHHYHQAEEVEGERRYARLAGEQAAAQYANAEAAGYLSRALALTPESDLEEGYVLLLAREKVYDLQGAREAQIEDLTALESMAKALSDETQQAKVALRQAHYAESTGDYPAAIDAAQAAIDFVQDPSVQAAGYLHWGQTLWRRRDYGAARTQLEKALDLARTTGSYSIEADSLRNYGIVLYLLNGYAEAKVYFEQALRIYQKLGDKRGESAALNNLGINAAEQGDAVEARSRLGQALSIHREIGCRRGESHVLNNLGVVCKQLGDYAAAKAHYERSLSIFRAIGDRQSEARALCNLGALSGDQGDCDGLHHCEQAKIISCELGDRLGEGAALHNQAGIFWYLGVYARAKDCFIQALCIHRETDDQRGETMILADLSLLFHNLGDDKAARQYAEQALSIAQELDDRSSKGRALTHLGHAQTGLGCLAIAAATYRQALDLRREIGEHHLAIESLAGLTRVSLAQGNRTQAQSQVEEILTYLETGISGSGKGAKASAEQTGHPLDGTNETFRIYLTCYQVLLASQDPRAGELLGTAYHLLQERAAQIDDQALRRSFLENVAVHREIVQAWEGAR